MNAFDFSSGEIPDQKLTDYLLNLDHPRGKSKAVALLGMGFSLSDLDTLKEAFRRCSSRSEIQRMKSGSGERPKVVTEGFLGRAIRSSPIPNRLDHQASWFDTSNGNRLSYLNDTD
ncbi:MAG: DUF6883 domain-containing protein [Opitutales bacterium]